jgi:hypothetical protein
MLIDTINVLIGYYVCSISVRCLRPGGVKPHLRDDDGKVGASSTSMSMKKTSRYRQEWR